MNPMYMARIRDDLLKSYEHDKVLKFLHVPLQSGSDKVLNDMKRGHTATTFKDIATRFRKKFPASTLSTDIIVGFPTEDEKDFQKTVDILKEIKPDIVNLSRYSQRSGTIAAELNQVEISEVKRRSKLVFDLTNKIASFHIIKYFITSTLKRNVKKFEYLVVFI